MSESLLPPPPGFVLADDPSLIPPPPPGFIIPHPVAGPSGDEALDWKRKLGSFGTEAIGNVLGIPRAGAQALDWAARGGVSDFGIPEGVGRAIGAPLRAIQPQGGFSEAMGSIKAPGTNDPLFPTMQQAKEGAFQTTGATEYQPATWAGRRLRDAMTAAPFALAAPATLPAMLMGGAGAGQAAETAHNMGAPESVQVAAGLLGGVGGAKVGSALGNAASNVVGVPTPFGRPVSSTRADLARIATDKYDIPVRGAMVEGRTSPARYFDSMLNDVPLTGHRASTDAIQTAYNRAVGKTFGANAPELSTDVFAKAHTDLVNNLNQITPSLRINRQAWNSLSNDLGAVETWFTRLKGQDQIAPVKSAIDEILDVFTTNNNSIPGDVYHSMVKKGGHLDRMRRSQDPDVRAAGGDIMDALENAVEVSLPAGSTALKDFRDWRGQWRSMRVAEDAVDASGNVTGAKLNQVADRSTTNYKSGGGGDIAELGRIGGALLPEPPNSGTAQRTMWQSLLAAPAGMAGAAGTAFTHPELAGALAAGVGSAAAGGAITLGAGRAGSAYLRSPQYLERAIISGLSPDAFRFRSPDMLAKLLMGPQAADRANSSNLPGR